MQNSYGHYIPGLVFATTSSYTIDVTCSDAWGSDTESITVSVTQNAAPSMSGFPASVSITVYKMK
jgi:PKD repeat protein